MPTVSANPLCVRTLHQAESDRLRRFYPNLPRSLDECPTCNGRGTFRWWDDPQSPEREAVEWECNCAEQFKLQRYLLNAGIRGRYQRLGWADATGIPTQVREAADNYRDDADSFLAAGLGILFYGPPGTGKTLLSALLTKSLLAIGKDAYFVELSDMMDRYAEGWKSEDDKLWFQQRIRHVPFLVVDDIGREQQSKMTESLLDRVFRHRVADSLSSVATSNNTSTEMGENYSANVLSLITEVTEEHYVPGVDFRSQASEIRREERREGLTRPIVLS